VDIQSNPTAKKLLGALLQFKKAGWHQRSVMGYKPSEIRVLFCISKEKGPEAHDMKVSEISKRLQVTPPTVTQLIKGLEANGLVERNVDLVDRRAVGIKLTDKGEMVTRQASEAFFASINGLIEYLGEEQSDQLAELLVKVSRYYYEENQRINEKTACAEFEHWSGEEDL
jgi:DNA-binding MarR family transcriptional regulator